MEFIDLKSQQALVREDIDKRIAAVLDHGRYIMGPEVAELEEELAKYVGVKHCVGAASGTDTLLISLMALGLEPGDEVITVPYTWISTAEMIALIGAKPVFVDIDPLSWNMDVSQLEAAITKKTKAIMPVGIYGQTADMTAINVIAAKYDLPVIEDAAQSFGSTHHGVKSCALSTIGSTSFFPSKPLGCYGDGGALFTNDDELAGRMRQIRVHGQQKKHHHPILGINGRLDTIQAAVLLTKLPIFDDEIEKRQKVAEAYSEAISNSALVGKGLQLPVVTAGNTSVWAQYTMLSPSRDALRAKLNDAGIPNVSYYAVPLHLQPVFSDLNHKSGDFPVSERVANEGISLPMNPYLSTSEIGKVIKSFDD
jgi:UDP-2-acetamido-2-deoxy-ribo-hexuluronate aminotransferase